MGPEKSALQRVASTLDVAEGGMLCVELQGRDLLICHTADGYFAIENLCSHARARMSDGRLRGNRILCPLHGAAFDVRDGSVLRPPAMRPIQSYPLEIVGEDILVDVSD